MLTEKTLKEQESRVEFKSGTEKRFAIAKEIRRGNIFWCDFGSVNSDKKDCTQKGVRPAIIVSNEACNKYSPVVIVAAITSKINKTKLPTHVGISSEKYGLNRDSVILTEQIITVDKNRIGDFICTLDAYDTQQVNKALSISIELAHIEKTNNINGSNSTNNVIDMKIINVLKEKAKEIEELDTTLRVLVSRNIDINMMKPILQERQDKIREFYIICENNNIKNPDKYYMDYNKQKLENKISKSI